MSRAKQLFCITCNKEYTCERPDKNEFVNMTKSCSVSCSRARNGLLLKDIRKLQTDADLKTAVNTYGIIHPYTLYVINNEYPELSEWTVGHIKKYFEENGYELSRCSVCKINVLKYDSGNNLQKFCSNDCRLKNLVSEFSNKVNPFTLPEVKDKIKKTVKEKYGVDHISQLPKNIEISKQILIDTSAKRHSSRMSNLAKKYADEYAAEGIKFLTEYKSCYAKVKMQCSQGHTFERSIFCNKTPWRTKILCPKCSTSTSERFIIKILDEANIAYELHNRKLIHPYELDIVIPSLKLAIEINGNYWHCDKFKPDNYHLDKLNMVNNAGYELLSLFEDEIINKGDIVKDRILYKCKLGNKPIGARKTSVVKLSASESNAYLNSRHIQGGCNSPIRYGLKYNDELVAVATFSKVRKCLGRRANDISYELVRYCGNVAGGLSKLISEFKKDNEQCEELISYCDRRWNNGSGYIAAGAIKVSISKPGYFYVHQNNYMVRHNRFKFRKSELSKLLEKFDPVLSERQNMDNHGYFRLYDCGTIVYKFIV